MPPKATPIITFSITRQPISRRQAHEGQHHLCALHHPQRAGGIHTARASLRFIYIALRASWHQRAGGNFADALEIELIFFPAIGSAFLDVAFSRSAQARAGIFVIISPAHQTKGPRSQRG